MLCSSSQRTVAGRRLEAERAAAGEDDGVDLVDHVERVQEIRFARAGRAAALRDAADRVAVDENHGAAGRAFGEREVADLDAGDRGQRRVDSAAPACVARSPAASRSAAFRLPTAARAALRAALQYGHGDRRQGRHEDRLDAWRYCRPLNAWPLSTAFWRKSIAPPTRSCSSRWISCGFRPSTRRATSTRRAPAFSAITCGSRQFDVEYIVADGRPEHTARHPRVNVVGVASGRRRTGRPPERAHRRRAARRRVDARSIRRRGARWPDLRARRVRHEGGARRGRVRGGSDRARRRDAAGDARDQRHGGRRERRLRRRGVARGAGPHREGADRLRHHSGAAERRPHLRRPSRRVLVRVDARGRIGARQHAVSRCQRDRRHDRSAVGDSPRARAGAGRPHHGDAGGAGGRPPRHHQRQRASKADNRSTAFRRRASPIAAGRSSIAGSSSKKAFGVRKRKSTRS